MYVLFQGTGDQVFESCNRSALRHKGWMPIDELSEDNLVDAQYMVCQYDEATCNPQMLVGLAEYNFNTNKLEQVGFTAGFRLNRIDYFMVATPTPQEFSARRFGNTVIGTMVNVGLLVGNN